MEARQAGKRLILLTLPFLAFGLLWALDPPAGDALGGAESVARGAGAVLALLGVVAVVLGLYLIGRGDDRIL